jgi:hypothetical protein
LQAHENINRYFLLVAFLVLNSALSFGQRQGQTVRGTLSDRITGASLPGAVLVIDAVSPAIGTATDANGQFKLEQVPYGRYSIKVSLMGYSPLEVKDVITLPTGPTKKTSFNTSPSNLGITTFQPTITSTTK